MTEDSVHYEFMVEHKGPLNATFEVDGKTFVTDRPTLDRLNSKRADGSLRIAAWLFAVNPATGRIQRSSRPNSAAN